MIYQVLIQPKAEADIEETLRWLAARAPEYAVTW